MNDDRKFKSKKSGLLKLLKAGFPAFIIEQLLEISEATFFNYLRKVKVSGEFEGELLSKKQSLNFLFEVYCKIETNIFKNYDSLRDLSLICREKIKIILKEYFNIEEIVLYLDGVSDTIVYNSTVKFDSRLDDNYKFFLLDIYPSVFSPNAEINFWTGERILNNYCIKVVKSSVLLVDNVVNLPDYITLLKNHVVADILYSSRKYFAPTIGVEAVGFVDKALSDLREKYRLVLQKYYGLAGFEKISIKEIAKEFGVSRTSIGQRKNKGIWTFKSSFDTSIFDSIDNCLSIKIKLKKKHKKELSALTKKWINDFNKMTAFYTGMDSVSNFSSEDVKFLITPVKKLEKEFSLRLYHCLTYKFNRIYEVLQSDKEKLLWIRMFGKRSLIELEAWVSAKGFKLETKFSKEDIVQFEGLIAMEEEN